MLNCSFLSKSDAQVQDPIPGDIKRTLPVDSSPIEWSNRYWMYDAAVEGDDAYTELNPHPPMYNPDLDRWTNRVCVESCYYWDAHRYMPEP